VTAKGIPYLKIETDYSTADRGQINTRLEAFLETIQK
jgi:benzoyl-CoA reductase/2-hydroxyglutaryl-CoA dehydratase subunit BcrC/BadD/HgdB